MTNGTNGIRRLIRAKRVREEKFDGMSEAAFWELRKGCRTFPKAIAITSRTVAFYEDEVDAWLETRRQASAVAR
jgi:predicted DNA-binding transcriptional regulator AlpA